MLAAGSTPNKPAVDFRFNFSMSLPGSITLTLFPDFWIKPAMRVESFGVFCILAQTRSLTATSASPRRRSAAKKSGSPPVKGASGRKLDRQDVGFFNDGR